MIGNNSKYSVETTFSLEDYFPVKVGLNNYIDNIRYIQYEKDNFNMLEVTANKTSNEFYRLQLVISSSFSITDESISLIENYEEGIAVFDEPEVVKTELFDVMVYCDGLSIIFEKDTVARWIKTGSVLFGLNEDSILAEIKVVDITPVVRDHIISELNQD